MKYSAVVFDLDGTILDTLLDLKNATNAALTQCGYPERTLEEVRMFVGNGIRKLIERAVPKGTSAEDTDKVHRAFTEYYKAHCADNTRPYNGIPKLLYDLKAAGVKTAVVSNKADYAVGELCRDYFDGLFDFYVGEREGIRKKPAPDSVLEALKNIGVSVEQAVYIGDSDVDIDTAKNSGLAFIGVSYGFRGRGFLEAHGAVDIADSVEDIYRYL